MRDGNPCNHIPEPSFESPLHHSGFPAYYTLSGHVSPPVSPHGRRCWRGRWRPTAPPSKRAAATPAAWCCASGTRRRRREGGQMARGGGLLHLGVGFLDPQNFTLTARVGFTRRISPSSESLTPNEGAIGICVKVEDARKCASVFPF